MKPRINANKSRNKYKDDGNNMHRNENKHTDKNNNNITNKKTAS